MKKCWNILLFLLVIGQLNAQHIDSLRAILMNPERKEVIIVAHRGDWRNAPENSMKAFQFCIAAGFDMIEIDIKKSKDNHLVIMHDDTIDRTTNGKGKVSDYTLEELGKFRLKNGIGRVTQHKIPTLKEVLELSKGRILINVDKGYNYFKDVYALLEETGTTNQVVIKSGHSLAKVKAENDEVLDKVIYMPIIAIDQSSAQEKISAYMQIKPVAIECTFSKVTPEVLNSLKRFRGSETKIWINSLWPSLNAGHDDDKAVEENKPDETWGWLIDQGATIIQTDRPYELLSYLRKKGLHK